MAENTNIEAAETVSEKLYTFRELGATDIAPMCKIIGKIGIPEFGKCFQADSVLNLVNELKSKSSKNLTDIAGIQVMLEIATVVITHIPDCEDDIFGLLASVSGLTVDKIKTFKLAEITQMIVDFCKKEEFKDFIKVVSALFN